MSEFIKQSNPEFSAAPYDAIITDGCLYRGLLKGAEKMTGRQLSLDEIKSAFHYAVPDFMEDHRHPEQDRCFIKWTDKHIGHEEIIRIGLYILGERNVKVKYRARVDMAAPHNNIIIGRPGSLDACNFFISKCKTPKGAHFYESNIAGGLVWDPGQSYTDKLLSIRGFEIRIL